MNRTVCDTAQSDKSRIVFCLHVRMAAILGVAQNSKLYLKASEYHQELPLAHVADKTKAKTEEILEYRHTKTNTRNCTTNNMIN